MRFVVAADDVLMRNQLRELVRNFGVECGAEDAVDLKQFFFRVTQSPPSAALIALGADPKPAIEVIKLTQERAAPPLFAVGPAEDSGLFMETVRLGAGFLDRANLRRDFEQALKKLRHTNYSAAPTGRIIVVTAANPGSGVTTISAGLAFALAEKNKPGTAALAEFGNTVPELALLLNLNPPNTVDHLFRDWQKVDSSMLRQAAAQHEAGVSVLAYAPQTLASMEISVEALHQTISLMRAAFGVSVIDLGHSASPAALGAMRIADQVLVVSRGDVPALRLCREYLHSLRRNEIREEKICRVANMFGKRRQLRWQQMEEALGKKFDAWIPDDPGAVVAAANLGVPLVEQAKSSRIVRRLRELAQRLTESVAV